MQYPLYFMEAATILLPNFNNQFVLPITFHWLRKNIDCAKVHFLMVDDGSEDASVAVAKQEVTRCGFASSEIIERTHEGIVPTLNCALSMMKTKFAVRIDGDATVQTPGWISILLETLRFDEVGIVGGQVIWESGRVHSFGRSVFSEWGLHDMGCCPLEPAGHRTYDSIVYRPFQGFRLGSPYEVDTILGVCTAFRREEALAVGGFDMRFNPVWIEDDDFGLSLRKLGKRIIVHPSVQVVHRPSLRGSRKPGEPAIKQQKSSNSALRALRKNLSSRVSGSIRALCDEPRPPLAIEHFVPVESDSWRRSLLQSHYANWRTKWGFDPVNPDMNEVMQRYWDTSICRNYNPSQLHKSREFLGKLAANIPPKPTDAAFRK